MTTGARTGSGVKQIIYSASGAQTIPSTTASGASVTLPAITAEGMTMVTYFATDNAGNAETPKTLTIKLDKTNPTTSCATPDGQWHKDDVTLACTASDGTSGLVNAADATFSLSTTVPANTETANAATNSHQVCDVAGNCATAGSIAGNKVDKKSPAISISVLVSATPYLLHQAVTVNYSCVDGGSGVAACAGPVANGGALDTTTVGTKTFNVAAVDQVGNASNQTVNYTVTYNICALYDQTKAVNSGATIPIKLQLCDAQGTNISASTHAVTAVKVTQTSTSTSRPVQDAGNANPDSNFRYDPTLGGTGGHIYNLSTKGLATGTYALSFTVAGDPVAHTVQFQVN